MVDGGGGGGENRSFGFGRDRSVIRVHCFSRLMLLNAARDVLDAYLRITPTTFTTNTMLSTRNSSLSSSLLLSIGLGLSLAVPLLSQVPSYLRRLQRASKLPYPYERVLIIGASSGIGRSTAHLYASRGARVYLASFVSAHLTRFCRCAS